MSGHLQYRQSSNNEHQDTTLYWTGIDSCKRASVWTRCLANHICFAKPRRQYKWVHVSNWQANLLSTSISSTGSDTISGLMLLDGISSDLISQSRLSKGVAGLALFLENWSCLGYLGSIWWLTFTLSQPSMTDFSEFCKNSIRPAPSLLL
jgi:hypothetical protein